MKRLILSLIFLLPGTAFAAEPLTERQVKQFVAVAQDMEKLEDKYPEGSLDLNMEEEGVAAMNKMFADDGSIRVMDLVVAKAKENPALYEDMTRSIRRNGFGSPQEFADIGDRIVLAAARSEMGEQELAQMKAAQNMPKEQLAQMPANMRSALEKALLFADALVAVPASDVALVKQYKPQLDALND